MNMLKSLAKKFEAKAGDHPNASSDPNINPTSGVQHDSCGDGKSSDKISPRAQTDVNIFPDPLVKETKERISSGQGSDHPKETIRAGSSTSADTVSAGVASGAIDRG